ncbi:unnamed protein product [Timema podura]|uniref:Uncharacterized protein n=1 Tax=Timema podura TaxID=61482 RepID=A0ABN7NIH6_TIMPD|nr:unnamed protein product [Timema podura]
MKLSYRNEGDTLTIYVFLFEAYHPSLSHKGITTRYVVHVVVGLLFSCAGSFPVSIRSDDGDSEYKGDSDYEGEEPVEKLKFNLSLTNQTLVTFGIVSLLEKYPRYLNKGCNADPLFNFEYRGPVTMKGKSEPMDVWFLTRSKEYIV